MKMLLGAMLLTLSVGVAAGEADPRREVEGLIARAARGGKQITIHFSFLGAKARGRITGVTDDGVKVDASGYETPLKWNDFEDTQLAAAGMKSAESGEDYLVMARYYAAIGDTEKADAAAAKAVETDAGMKEKVDEFLNTLHPPEEKKPVLIIRESKPKEQQMPVRKNHEGRPLPPTPKLSEPILFDTPQADAVLSTMQIFPTDNPWNMDISKNPVHPNSDNIIASIGRDRYVHCNEDMAFVLVPGDQKRVNITFDYSGESDKGPYPVPENAPVEGLADQHTGTGDRHVIVVDVWNMMLYEMFHSFKQADGWRAGSGAVFDLKNNKTRPRGWTSSDAAGLPIFPAIVRYDECERGMVEHAIRVTCRRTRKEYLYPATHYAAESKDPNLPAMGQRIRLKADVDISGFPKHARAVVLAMKKYGMFVADNGSDWYISTAPDKRIKDRRTLHRLKGSDFEVVVTYDQSGKPQY
ncbi:MAG: hypothetical protein JW909_05820 [Planctomycetes bacterium]|nr:hypothetical protein [Planctomycetota bacterium]